MTVMPLCVAGFVINDAEFGCRLFARLNLELS